MHHQHNLINRKPSHFAKQATLQARSGISPSEFQQAKAVHRAANLARHSWNSVDGATQSSGGYSGALPIRSAGGPAHVYNVDAGDDTNMTSFSSFLNKHSSASSGVSGGEDNHVLSISSFLNKQDCEDNLRLNDHADSAFGDHSGNSRSSDLCGSDVGGMHVFDAEDDGMTAAMGAL
eukprot:11050156-Karenia_brevis.AAC.1